MVSPTRELTRGGGRGGHVGRRGGYAAGAGPRSRNTRGSTDAHAITESEKSDVDERERDKGDLTGTPKDADVVVVDASLLVHALGQLKAWCKKGRKEIVVVPLEGELHIDIDLYQRTYANLIQRSTLSIC